MSNTELQPPFLLREYKELVQIQVCYDEVCHTSQQLITPIVVPDCPVEPQVLLQCIDNGHNTCGPKYVYDWDKGEFVEFNEQLHAVPSSAPVEEVDPPSRQLDVCASSEVEFESEVETPQVDDEGDEELYEDDE